ncbi:MAG: hypothetical protein U1D67_07995, partial [Dehalococcoidia bacterium]|nr:hypothetical protein [Dehalococcoidia bacterium]
KNKFEFLAKKFKVKIRVIIIPVGLSVNLHGPAYCYQTLRQALRNGVRSVPTPSPTPLGGRVPIHRDRVTEGRNQRYLFPAG